MSSKSVVFTLDENVKTLRKGVFDAYQNDKYKKFKKVSIMCYEEDALKYFLSNTHPYSFAWICHDKDVDDNGNKVVPHYHCVAKYTSGIRVSHLRKCFSQNVFFEVPFNDDAIEDYLLHTNAPDKFQYDTADCHTWTERGKRSFFVSKEEFQTETMAEMLADLQTLSMRELALKYGRDMMINYHKYNDFVKLMIAEEEDING